ncbi:MAG: apolipoprotein N-acyltransferase [Candidatus Cryptobacteroides sp.]
MKKERILIWFLAVLSGLLLSLPYLVPHCGFIALFSFIPLLCADRIATLGGYRRLWMPVFTAFLVWNGLTTFWVCNATVGGGIAAVVLNSLQMLAIWGLYRLSRRTFSGSLPYIFFAAAWIAWEKAYFAVDISWPWLTLGNAFARSLYMVQWYDTLGSLGGSLWVWASNLLIFGMMTALSDGRWAGFGPHGFNRKARLAYLLGLAFVLAAPLVWSLCKWFREETLPEERIDVLVAQPNIDPYHKFVQMSRREQDALLESQLIPALEEYRAELAADSLWRGRESIPGMLILSPETFTSYVFTNSPEESVTLNRFKELLEDCPGVNMIVGASSYTIIESVSRPSHTARSYGEGRWIESHNSAIMIDGSGRNQFFHKNKLVVAVEMLPYPAVFDPIDRALGGVMGRCIGQGAASNLDYVAGDGTAAVPIGCAICYESVYGDYCREYILKGARALAIITNDAWWGDTPGYRQHLSYASLRAIETRRWIARCGNTGISGLIDDKGRIVEKGKWWEKTTLRFALPLQDGITPFVKYGDVVGRICTWVFLLLLAALTVKLLTGERGKAAGGKKVRKA